MQDLNYSWRFEAGTEYICPMDDDPFQYMFENKKTTSFSVALYEYRETIPSLYQTVMDFALKNDHWIQPASNPKTLWHFILDESSLFNGCHFWNNFQVRYQYEFWAETNCFNRLPTSVFIEERNTNHFSITWMNLTVFFMNDGEIQLFNHLVQLCFLQRMIFIFGIILDIE